MKVGFDRARGYAIDPDCIWRQFACERFGIGRDECLGGGIDRGAGTTACHRGDRNRVDNRRAVGRPQSRQQNARKLNDGCLIEPDDRVVFSIRQRACGKPANHRAGIVDEHMHRAKSIQSFRRESSRAVRRQKIGCNENCASLLLCRQQEVRQIPFAIPASVNQDVRAAIQELPRDFEADSTPCAGHDNIAIFKKFGVKHA